MNKFEHNPPTETEIRELAHHLWHERGCPQGSPEVDWFAALFQLEANATLRRAQGRRERGDAEPLSAHPSWRSGRQAQDSNDDLAISLQ